MYRKTIHTNEYMNYYYQNELYFPPIKKKKKNKLNFPINNLFILIIKEFSMAKLLGLSMRTQTSGCSSLRNNSHRVNSGYH